MQIRKRKAELIFTKPVHNAFGIEQSIHVLFSDKNVRPNALTISTKYKIGISNNPNRRAEEVNESNLRSGHTEFFALNWLELALVILLIHYHTVKPYIYISGIIAVLVFIIYKTTL